MSVYMQPGPFTGSHLGLKSFRGGCLSVVWGWRREARRTGVVVVVVVDSERKLYLSRVRIHKLLWLQTFDFLF